MKKFFGLYITYSKFIFKFWVTQITMSVFGVLVGAATSVTRSEWLILCSAFFAIGFFVFLLYDMMFMHGLNDSVRKYKDGTAPDKLEGLKIAMLSYAPTILIVILQTIFIIFNLNASAVTQFILQFVIHGTYFGFSYLMLDYIYPSVLPFLTLIPGLVACTLGYYLGLRDLPIRKILGIPVNPPKPPKNKK